MKTNFKRGAMLLVFLFGVLIASQYINQFLDQQFIGEDEQGTGVVIEGGPTSPGTLMQLAAKGPQDFYLTGMHPYYRGALWGHNYYGPSYHGSFQRYRPVKTHADYDHPHYYRAYKYPYYFDSPLMD